MLFNLFSDHSDLDGVKRSWDVKYTRRLGQALTVFGAWPLDPRERSAEAAALADARDADGAEPWQLAEPRPLPEKVPGGLFRRNLRWYVLLQGCVSLWFQLTFLFARFGELSPLILGHSVLTSLLNFVHISRCVMACTDRYYQLIEEYLFSIHLFNHKDRHQYCKQVHARAHTQCLALTTATVIIFVVGIPAYNLRPLINNISSGAYSGSGAEFQYSVYFQVPGVDLRHSMGPHILFSALNMGVSWWCVGSVWLPDLFAMQVVLHIGGHIDILRNEMKVFGEEMILGLKERIQFSEEETVIVNNKLKYFVNYHRKILRYVSMTNNTFNETYLIYFTYFQVSLCIMMWQCSQGSEGLLQYGMLLSASVLSLAVLCVVFEMIGTESGLLEVAVYGLPWQYMRVPSRRMVLLSLFRSQEPLRMKVLGIDDVGLATMAAILKTSVSYFMLLRSVD